MKISVRVHLSVYDGFDVGGLDKIIFDTGVEFDGFSWGGDKLFNAVKPMIDRYGFVNFGLDEDLSKITHIDDIEILKIMAVRIDGN